VGTAAKPGLSEVEGAVHRAKLDSSCPRYFRLSDLRDEDSFEELSFELSFDEPLSLDELSFEELSLEELSLEELSLEEPSDFPLSSFFESPESLESRESLPPSDDAAVDLFA
jgi:hypothetical protein